MKIDMTLTPQKKDNNLTWNENLGLRGLCITLIVLHNFIHNILTIQECEKFFYSERADFYLHSVLGHPITGTLSYLGWIGVPVFFFLSGYGLSSKYGRVVPNVFSFVSKHYLKLLLLAGPVILFKNLNDGTPILDILGQLTFLNNLFNRSIGPASFWFLRVAFEFYILYALVLRFIPPKLLLGFGIIVLCSYLFISEEVCLMMKNHFLGWLFDFSLGLYLAQNPRWIKRIENIYSSICLFALVMFSSVNFYAWPFSTTLTVLFFLSIKRYLTNRPLVFLGTISASLYVTHSVVRNIWQIQLNLDQNMDYMNGNRAYFILLVISFFLSAVIVAYLYGKLYKIAWTFFQDRLFKKERIK